MLQSIDGKPVAPSTFHRFKRHPDWNIRTVPDFSYHPLNPSTLFSFWYPLINEIVQRRAVIRSYEPVDPN